MTKRIICISVLISILGMAAPLLAKPVITVENPRYEFKAVPDGTRITHEFVIKNTGDETLVINDVLPP